MSELVVEPVGRTWLLWSTRREDGELWYVGDRWWVELHDGGDALVPVLAEEWLGDPHDAAVTHYGWERRDGPECAVCRSA